VRTKATRVHAAADPGYRWCRPPRRGSASSGRAGMGCDSTLRTDGACLWSFLLCDFWLRLRSQSGFGRSAPPELKPAGDASLHPDAIDCFFTHHVVSFLVFGGRLAPHLVRRNLPENFAGGLQKKHRPCRRNRPLSHQQQPLWSVGWYTGNLSAVQTSLNCRLQKNRAHFSVVFRALISAGANAPRKE
jgi:hypothetical protein